MYYFCWSYENVIFPFQKKKMHASPRSLASLHCQNLPGNRSCQPWKGIFVILWSINGQLTEILTAGEGCKNTEILSIKLLLRETSGEVCKNNPFFSILLQKQSEAACEELKMSFPQSIKDKMQSHTPTFVYLLFATKYNSICSGASRTMSTWF